MKKKDSDLTFDDACKIRKFLIDSVYSEALDAKDYGTTTRFSYALVCMWIDSIWIEKLGYQATELETIHLAFTYSKVIRFADEIINELELSSPCRQEIRLLVGWQLMLAAGACSPTLNQEEAVFDEQLFGKWLVSTPNDFYIRKEENEKEDSITTFKKTNLKSTGHKALCKKLEEMQVMFFYEAPCSLPEDKKWFRRIDLIVVKNDRAVIVEIDGEWHANELQRRDDYERDRLIGKQWNSKCRLTNREIEEDLDGAIKKIMSFVDPNFGKVSKPLK